MRYDVLCRFEDAVDPAQPFQLGGGRAECEAAPIDKLAPREFSNPIAGTTKAISIRRHRDALTFAAKDAVGPCNCVIGSVEHAFEVSQAAITLQRAGERDFHFWPCSVGGQNALPLHLA